MPSRKVNRDKQRIIGHRLFLEKQKARAKAANDAKTQADRALEEYNRKNGTNH